MRYVLLLILLTCALPAMAKPVLVSDKAAPAVTWDRRREGLILELRGHNLRVDLLTFDPLRWRTVIRNPERDAFVSYPQPGVAEISYPSDYIQSYRPPRDHFRLLVDLATGREHPLDPPRHEPYVWLPDESGAWLQRQPPDLPLYVRLAVPGQINVKAYANFEGKLLNQFQVATGFDANTYPGSYCFLDLGVLYVMHRDGLIRRYEVATGQELEPMTQVQRELQQVRFQNFFMHEPGRQNWGSEIEEERWRSDRIFSFFEDGMLTLETMPNGRNELDRWRRLEIALDLRSGQILAQRDGELGVYMSGVLGAWVEPDISFRLPRARFSDYQQYRQVYTALKAFDLPKGLIIVNELGHYAAFGDYQTAAHFEERGKKISWAEMEACCHRPEELQAQLVSIAP